MKGVFEQMEMKSYLSKNNPMKGPLNFLWFDTQALDAAEFYVKLIPNSSIKHVSYYGKEVPNFGGMPWVVEFELNGVSYAAMNAGKHYELSPAFSISISCKDQAEIDFFWNELTSNGGVESRCGWCVDRFGLSWQIIPENLSHFLGNPDPVKAGKAMQAMLKMAKFELHLLEEAIA